MNNRPSGQQTAPPQQRPLAAIPDLLTLHAAWPERYPALLESAADGTAQARYDILLALPTERLTLHADGRLEAPAACGQSSDFLTALDAWQQHCGCTRGLPELPFCGGWLLYLSYELAGSIEPTLQLPLDETQPIAVAQRCEAAIIRDHEQNRAWLVCEAGVTARAIAAIEADIAAAPPLPIRHGDVAASLAEEPPERYLLAVRAAAQHIVDGDVFQANLSRAWRGRMRPGFEPAELYRRLRSANPAPFAGIVQLAPGLAIVSSSPERLLLVHEGIAQTRPIAGTRRRDRSPSRDRDLSAELLAHPKERAEHIMLIDLERNDLGRVCKAGTVVVDEMMVLESYAHVHHIVSNVRGELLPEVQAGDAIRAVFPGGTITGCPKVRCMEIIAALEHEPRGPYTGSFGYLSRDGRCDLNILIRTILVRDGSIELRAGAGIVADSIAERELDETRAKARGLLLALNDQSNDQGNDEGLAIA